MWHSIGNGNSVLFGGDRACEVFELCESVVGHVTVMVAGGSSTLHWAGQDGQTGVVKALLAAGACLHASSSAPPAIAWGVSVAIKVSCCFMFDIVLDSNCCLLFAASSHVTLSRTLSIRAKTQFHHEWYAADSRSPVLLDYFHSAPLSPTLTLRPAAECESCLL